VLVDRLFKNVKLNANDTVHEHHGNPANAAGYKFFVTAWSIEATLFYLGAPRSGNQRVPERHRELPLGRGRLAVTSGQVGQAADRRSAADGAAGSVMIVEVQHGEERRRRRTLANTTVPATADRWVRPPVQISSCHT